MMENPARILATLLLGNTFVNIATSSLGVNLISTYFRGDRAIVVSTLAMTVLILVFGEITPKTMAVQRSESIASWVVNPLNVFSHYFPKLNTIEGFRYALKLFRKGLFRVLLPGLGRRTIRLTGSVE